MPPRIWLASPPHAPEGLIPVVTHWETTTKPNIGIWGKTVALHGVTHHSRGHHGQVLVLRGGNAPGSSSVCCTKAWGQSPSVHPWPHSQHSCWARQEERLSTFHPVLNTRRLRAKHDFPKGPAWWCTKDRAGDGDWEDPGGRFSASQPHKLCSDTRFPMEQMLNPCF